MYGSARHTFVFASLTAAIFFTTPGDEAVTHAPLVRSTSPASNSLTASPSTSILLEMDAALDPSSLGADKFSVFGRWSGVMTGRVELENNNTAVRFTPDAEFMAGEMVTASLSRSVTGVDGKLMDTSYTWAFWIAAGAGSLDLEKTADVPTRRPGESRVQSYGAYAGDLDDDGFTDLAVPNEIANDVRVFFNDGHGNYSNFTILDIPNGAVPSPNEGADFNGDGIVDFAVGNAGNDLVSIFIGEGNGRFRHDGNYRAGRGVRGVCLLDLNSDGAIDIATANMSARRRGNVTTLINDGHGQFTRDIETNGDQARGEKSCATADANGDGIMDVFVGAYSSGEVLIYLGDGVGGLNYHAKVDAGGAPWMIVSADINGDGHADVIAGNRRENSVSVLYGDGRGNLAEAISYDAGEQPLAVDVGDIDGDGDLDVISSNLSSKDFTLFENAGDGRLVNPRRLLASGAGSCAIVHDRDNDGDLDITGVDEIDDFVFLYTNPG